MFGRLTPEERAEFLRLYDIFMGRAVVPETGPLYAPVDSGRTILIVPDQELTKRRKPLN